MVRKYLNKKHVIQEEDLLEKIADSTDKSELKILYDWRELRAKDHDTLFTHKQLH